MKNKQNYFLYCCTCMIVLISCKPQKTEVVQNYGTGEVSKRYNVIDGKKQGLMSDYYRDGTRKMERWFRNDTQVDKAIMYYKTGELMEIQHYDNGIRQGGDSTFYEDGSIQQVVEYKNGIKDGYVRKWKPDGTLIYEARFDQDSLLEVTVDPMHPDSLQKK